MKVRIALIIALLGCTVPASAQAVKIEFGGGRVNLSAQNAPLRAILAEWTRLGGTRIVNGERVTGPAVTLELTGVTERQAIDVLLRNAAGYIVGPRVAGFTGNSTFASIVILPTSAAPRQAAASFTPARQVRVQPPDFEPEPEPDPEEDPITDTPPDIDDRRVDSIRQAAEEANRRRIADRRAQIFVGDDVVIEQDDADGPRTPAPAAGSNPFGILPGAVRPGVITTPPPQTQGNRQRQPDPEP